MRTPLFALALALLLSSCAPQTGPGPASASLQPAGEGVTRFRVGALDAWSIQDATATLPNDGKTFAIGENPAAVRAVLTAAGAPTDSLRLDVNVLLVRTGDRLVLVDSGSGTVFGTPGRLPERLAATGVRADQITDVVISHSHADHLSGLLAGGRLAFPNARIHMLADEWAFLQGQADQAPLVAAIRGRVNPVIPGATIAPGIRSVRVEGHTPGHTAYEVSSGSQRLLAVGDTVHHYVLSVCKPEWTVQFDRDADTAERSRRALLAGAARDGRTLFVPHFPAPGLGTVRVEGDGFAWVPLGG